MGHHHPIGLLTALLVSGCAGGEPGAVTIVAQGDRCGGWRAVIEADAADQNLSLLVDGRPYDRWALDGPATIESSGRAPEAVQVSLEARLASGAFDRAVAALQIRAHLWVTPEGGGYPRDRPPTFVARVDTDCPREEIWWSARLEPGPPLFVRQRFPEDGGVALRIPADLTPGDYALVVNLDGPRGRIDQVAVPFAIGDRCMDWDGDGFPASAGCSAALDCDDHRGDVHPGRDDPPGDGLDNDCDGVNGQDRDADGFEDAAAGGDDCDDRDPQVRPGRPDAVDWDADGYAVADGIDHDCDGRLDEDVQRADCDDRDRGVHPGAAESLVPDGEDDDCDGRVDEGTEVFDDDGDGVSEVGGDCDDADPAVHPGGVEVPDCRDQDCDAVADEGVTRPQAPDAYGDNRDAAGAFDLETKGQDAFTATLRPVAEAEGDAAWFRFFADDGTLDAWSVELVADQIGLGGAWRATLFDDMEQARAETRFTWAGESLLFTGGALRDDSGAYWLRLVPEESPLGWCPAAFTLTAR